MCFELSKLINKCATFYAGRTECQNCVNDKNVRVVILVSVMTLAFILFISIIVTERHIIA